MKTNPLTSKLNNLRQALRHLWQTLRRLLCAQPNSPASLAEGGGGTGAGWYTRLQAAEGIKEVRSEVLSRPVGSRTIACPGAQPNSPASLAEGGGGTGAGGGLGTQPQKGIKPQKSKRRFAKYLIPIALLLFFLLISLVACKSPATLTNDTQHRTRDSNYHATVHRIETHDTIVIGIPTPSLCREGRGGSPLLRISDRKITLHDTVFILRTDTLLRTQTITQKERYIPPFYRFCTITLATLATLATLVFYIRLILRYRKIRSPT